MKKPMAILVLAMSLCLGLVNSATTISRAHPQEEKMQSQDKMSGERMQGQEKMSKKEEKKTKKSKAGKMDKRVGKGKMEEPKN